MENWNEAIGTSYPHSNFQLQHEIKEIAIKTSNELKNLMIWMQSLEEDIDYIKETVSKIHKTTEFRNTIKQEEENANTNEISFLSSTLGAKFRFRECAI